MRLRELFEARFPTHPEINAAMGQEVSADEYEMTPYSAPMRGSAATPFTVYQAISAVLGHKNVTNDDEDITPENQDHMVYVWDGSREGFFIPTDDGTGGSIEVQNMWSREAAAVAAGVHEAFHALVYRKTGGQGQLVSQEKIVNNLAEKWLRKHLTGMAQHVALERITGSRISYGSNHMPRPSNDDLRELFDAGTAFPYEWDQTDGPGYVVARAYDREGRLIEVNFTRDEDGNANIDFSRGGSMGDTGQGDGARVFATAINAIIEYVQKNDDLRVIYFVGDGASRKKLYDRIATRLGTQMGWHRAARPGGSVYKMVRDIEV